MGFNLFRRGLAILSVLFCIVLFMPLVADARAPDSQCNEKCLADYEEEAAKCGKMESDDARRKCQEDAHGRYKNCRETCQKKDNDCLEHCKELCDQIMDKCKEDCKKDQNPAVCRSRCMDDYSKCLKECDKRCK